MAEVLQARPVLALDRHQAQFLRAISRITARNVVREEAPKGVSIGRVHCHLGAEPEIIPYLKRKRTQPTGATECGECGKIVSANKGVCAGCLSRMQTEEAVAGC
jgi:hypothetical protein